LMPLPKTGVCDRAVLFTVGASGLILGLAEFSSIPAIPIDCAHASPAERT